MQERAALNERAIIEDVWGFEIYEVLLKFYLVYFCLSDFLQISCPREARNL